VLRQLPGKSSECSGKNNQVSGENDFMNAVYAHILRKIAPVSVFSPGSVRSKDVAGAGETDLALR